MSWLHSSYFSFSGGVFKKWSFTKKTFYLKLYGIFTFYKQLHYKLIQLIKWLLLVLRRRKSTKNEGQKTQKNHVNLKTGLH